MRKERIEFFLHAVWHRPKARDGTAYVWGARKSTTGAWAKPSLIYRWVRASDDQVAVVGEARRSLGQRVNSYTAGRGDGKAGRTNKRVFREQRRLAAKNDSLYLEYLVRLKGFNFTIKHQRRAAEGLLIAFYSPYCPSEGR
jgi:hypothetical protein